MMSKSQTVEKVIILAGGQGRRLNPYTVVLPKPLMPVGEIPILEVIIRQLKKYKLKDVTIAVGYLGNLIQTFFGDGRKFGIRVKYSYEEKSLGTMGPLTLIPGLKKTFMVMNGDLLTTLNYRKLINYHLSTKPIATIAVKRREIETDYGVLEYNKNYELTRYREKPRIPYQVSMGVYVFEPRILKYIPWNKKLDFPELMNLLLERKEKVLVYPSDDFWLDIGRPEDYIKAIEEFDKLKRKIF
ncbi:MAG: sugar phosphate nucleotidyltransferase [candidate division Zixibacteria bacterium]|nr:sugar phosphate nucleotidyltransferase [candidate division Zixibacteria bacterium]